MAHVCVSVCWLGLEPGVLTSLPGQMVGQQLLAKNVPCVDFAWHVSNGQTCEKNEMHDSIIVLCKNGWLFEGKCHTMNACRLCDFYITQTLVIKRLQAFRLYNDLCDKNVFHWSLAVINTFSLSFLHRLVISNLTSTLVLCNLKLIFRKMITFISMQLCSSKTMQTKWPLN